MSGHEGPLGAFNAQSLYAVLHTCAGLPDVRTEGCKNHDDNLWWPLSVTDWRLRMVAAGWSTRISYNMVTTYQRVIAEANEVGYDSLCQMPTEQLRRLLAPLGLFEARHKYLQSLRSFLGAIEREGRLVSRIPNDELIGLIARNVDGASFKVAQCAVLYAKGYHCGVFPVDSGMKDKLGPCLGLRLPSGPIAHEVMRLQLENSLKSMPNRLRLLAEQSGYAELQLPRDSAPVWWAHLVLIYFKRLYCNKRNPSGCPLRQNTGTSSFMGTMCDPSAATPGGYKHIVLEGVDKVGKSSVAEELSRLGYAIVHSPYNPDHVDIVAHYRSLIEHAPSLAALDRTFISEMVYGTVLRGQSRISDPAFLELVKLLAAKGYVVLHLKADASIIRERIAKADADHGQVYEKLDALLSTYENYMGVVASYVPVYEVWPSTAPKDRVLDVICQALDHDT